MTTRERYIAAAISMAASVGTLVCALWDDLWMSAACFVLGAVWAVVVVKGEWRARR